MPVINTNLSSLAAQNSFNIVQNNLQRSIESLTSGLRINRAADDAAGLAISQMLDAQLNGTQQAAQNVQQAMSMVQTADGALNGVQDILQQINTLGVQASNGTLNSTERGAIQSQINTLASSLNSVAANTQFNGQNLLSGNLAVQIGGGTIASNNPNLNVTNVDIAGAAPATTYTLSVCTTNNTATLAGGGVTQTITVNGLNANGSETLDFNAAGVQIQVQAGGSAISSTGVLNALAGGSTPITTMNATGAASIQAGANAGAGNQVALNFSAINTNALGLTPGVLDVSTPGNAQNLVSAVGNAMVAVDNQRASLGAAENGLSSLYGNLNTTSINTAAANSRITDLNVAQASVGLAINQIQSQAGLAVLAQSNLDQSNTLRLLQ
jgi:flagellin